MADKVPLASTFYHDATAIKDPAHLKQWLMKSDRPFVLLKSSDLVDSLPWPDGVEIFIQVIEAYRQHRVAIPVDFVPCPKLRVHIKGHVCNLCRNEGRVIARSKSDKLELDELKEAAVWLINQIREKDPTWNPFLPTP